MSLGEELKGVSERELAQSFRHMISRLIDAPGEAAAAADGISDDYPTLSNAIALIREYDVAGPYSEDQADLMHLGALRFIGLLREVDINRQVEPRENE